jgi:PBP1b-binding outer membrane lipoprotein LpoB
MFHPKTDLHGGNPVKKWMIAVILLLALALTSCANAEAAQPTAAEEPTVTSQESIPAPETETATVNSQESTPVPETEAATVPLELSNPWDIMDNPEVEEIPLLRGLEVEGLKQWMESTEFQEIKLYQRTHLKSIRLGTCGDVAVAQMSMCGDNEWETDGVIWNVRMEKADKLENRTGIEIPENADSYEDFLTIKKNYTSQCYFWPIDGDPENSTHPISCVEMIFFYFEDTKNLYSIYTNQILYSRNAKGSESNSIRVPSVVFQSFSESNRYGLNHEEIRLFQGKNDIRHFRIKMGDEYVVYQYVFGSKIKEWIQSPYNTDGWTLNPKDANTILSADGKWKVMANDYVYRTHLALPYVSG